jgi:transposase InsO family protein
MYFRTLLQLIKGYFKSRNQLVWENALLRYQLEVVRRRRRRILLKRWDRPILVWLTRGLSRWKDLIVVVQPESIIRWHRKAFSFYWGWKYSSRAGRPSVLPHTVHLIREMSLANPLWGAPRIHGELKKIGVNVSQSSVEKYMVRGSRPRGQNWKTFLKNHSKEIVAIDFFIVPTIKLKMLWALVVLSHDRRKILHFAVTHRPSGAWTKQQLRNAFPYKKMPRFILHDRDRNFWGLSRLGAREIITGHRCPWQNGRVERVIGSIRRECTDHLIVFGERHLKRVLSSYRQYYNKYRTHLALNKDSPTHRRTKVRGAIRVVPQVGGLHHRYDRVVARKSPPRILSAIGGSRT